MMNFKMANIIPLLIFLATLCLNPGMCLEIQDLKLMGGRGEYIEVNSGVNYRLSCTFRSGYDDPIEKVTWYLYGNPVYVWTASNDDIYASGVLMSNVDTSPDDEPASIHFNKLSYLLAGSYTCNVTSARASASKTYYLHVVDISTVPYDTSVHVLKDLNVDSGNDDENKYESYDTDLQPIDHSDDVDFEDAQCTLVWNFRSPAIFPKPNVTCGYYSFVHDDVIHNLPAGLTMHQFVNGSWKAHFDSTRVQVSSIPIEHRLACSIKIPNTSYREVIRSDDDFVVDSLIDSAGCPNFDDLTRRKGLRVESRDSTTNCRGNFLPNNRDGPAIVRLSCPSGQAAIFEDGTLESDWWMELSCFEYDQQWRSYFEGSQEGQIIDTTILPTCARGVNGGRDTRSSSLLSLVAVMLSTAAYLLNNH